MYSLAQPLISESASAALRAAIWSFRERTGLTWQDMQRGTALSHTGLWYIANGRRRPNIETRSTLVQFMENYLRDNPEQVRHAAPGFDKCAMPPKFQMTRAARTILAGIEHCARRKLNGVVLGDPGTGKTAAMEYFSATTSQPHVMVYCRAYTTYSHLLRSLARGLGITCGGACYEMDDEIHRELAVRPRLVLLDEADMLGARTLDWLRSIWDGSGKQSVFFLTAKPAFYERMQMAHARSRTQDLRQLWRRIAFRKFVSGIDRGELEAALVDRGLRDKFDEDALAALHEAVGGSFGELEVYLANIAQIVEENPKLDGRVTKKVVETAREVRFGVEFGALRRKA